MNSFPCQYCERQDPVISRSDMWNCFPFVVCISLKEREDRRKQVMMQFHRVGLCKRVLFYLAEKDKADRIRGCWESHRHVMQYGLERGAENMLIFEDDVCFDEKRMERVTSIMPKLPSNWDIFLLGHFALFSIPITKNITRTWSVCLHAYVVSQKYMRFMKFKPYNFEKEYPIDEFVKDTAMMYALIPMIAYQSGSPSSMERKAIQGTLSASTLNTSQYVGVVYFAIAIIIMLVLITVIIGVVIYYSKRSPSKMLK